MTDIFIIYFILFVSLLFSLTVIFWYAFRFEPVNFKVTENNIYIKTNASESSEQHNPDKTSDSAKPLKILHLSDLHLRTDYKGNRLAGFLKILSLDYYDLIFITGDMVEQDNLQSRLMDVVKNFRAKYGIYAVFGAHDYYNKKPSEFLRNMFKKKESYSRKNDYISLKNKLENAGIKVLLNENIILNEKIEGFPEIKIIGVDDPMINKMDIKKSLKGLNDNPEIIRQDGFLKSESYKKTFNISPNKSHELKNRKSLNIALIHTPDSYALANLALNGTDIIFAGHTHGGQVRVPGKGAIISGCSIKTKFASGLFYFNDFVLQVSRGLGEGRFSKFRVYCQPEAIITKLYIN
jgi:predicted MPP superfamily phosphohydrolase